jgi:hypothetical protein
VPLEEGRGYLKILSILYTTYSRCIKEGSILHGAFVTYIKGSGM